MNDIEKAQKAAEAANAKLAELEHQEAEKSRQAAVELDARQRELDIAFLAQWEDIDASLQAVGSKPAADVIYEGGDVVQAVSLFHIQRSKRNAVRAHARMAWFRVHGEHPEERFAMELSYRDMRITDRLGEAISGAAARHAADLAEALDAEWMVS